MYVVAFRAYLAASRYLARSLTSHYIMLYLTILHGPPRYPDVSRCIPWMSPYPTVSNDGYRGMVARRELRRLD